jgi:hypothetical protein
MDSWSVGTMSQNWSDMDAANDRWSILVLAKETLSLIELKPGAGNSRGWPHWTMDVGTEILKLEV